jgi:two-component system chemotaxis sensor kinase CheA
MEDPELLAEFVTESTEAMADIEGQLLEIESGGADINDDLVNTVFRGVHSIKGVAGFLGLTTINQLAHSLEDVLNRVRTRELVPTSEIVDVMLQAADELSSLVASPETSNDVDVAKHVAALNAINDSEAISEDTPSVDRSEKDISELADTAVKAADELEAVPEEGSTAEQATDKLDSPVPAAAEVPVEPKPKVTGASGRSASSEKSSTPAEASIRVSVSTLDHLMNLAGELVLNRNRLLQYDGLENDTDFSTLATDIDHNTCELQEAIMKTRMQPIGNVFTRFTRVVRDLSAKLDKQCKLVVDGKEVEVDKTIIEAIADPLTHLIRNAVDHGMETPAKRVEAGKPAEGLIQLRAFHQSGTVCIEIKDDGAGINVDAVKRKAVEKGLISTDQADAMHDRDAIRLILMPGFSTAEVLSDVSGRGVGMDVVRTNIEKLGGTVEIDSQYGSGTTIHVTLPLTLAIIQSLMVKCRDDRFAIPQVNILELVRLRGQEVSERIGTVNNAEVLRLRGRLLPLVRLREALGIDAGAPEAEVESTVATEQIVTDEAINIIVVETGQQSYGLIVDGLVNSEEIVVKPLGRHLSSCPCLTGATILGDGRVALILDVNGIAQQANLRVGDSETTNGDEAEDSSARELDKQSVLLFTNHPSEQFAVPMEAVARIERVLSDELVIVGGQELLHYRDSSLPLLRLENSMDAMAAPEDRRVNIIVFEAAGREFGVLATELVDICELPDDFEAGTFDDTVVYGSQVIQQKTTRLLDTIELARQSRPDWFEAKSSTTQPTSIDTTSPAKAGNPNSDWEPGSSVLLAEDSSFFRRQVKAFLEEAGETVIDCEDGREAWRVLKETPDRFRLVLTDIEMPNMDGLELTRAIRSEDRFSEIPIIALTSLASQEDFQRGYDAGVTEYQVKLDREKLISAVQKFSLVAV